MSTPQEASSKRVDGRTSLEKFNDCWGCRVLSGGGLVLSGSYVLQAARKVMKGSGSTSMGTVAQITFGFGLIAWGVVLFVDPVGNKRRKHSV